MQSTPPPPNAPKPFSAQSASGKMNKRTLKALQGSIRKWQGVVDGRVKDKGPSNCPLCEVFFYHHCRGCPVAEHTGFSDCYDTPYDEWCEASTPAEERRAARHELAFLKSLLPK